MAYRQRERGCGPAGRRKLTAYPGFLSVLVGVMLAAGAVGGCGSRDPNKALSDDEGATLLRDIRAGKTTVSDLTPADRVYLKGKMGK